jgi:murein DD-endopeptidase MepM/ murein hydrolase activator NlpD
MRFLRWLLGLIVLAGLGFGIVYYFAGTLAGPSITINQPSIVGQESTLDVVVDAPGAELSALTIQLEQKGRMLPVFDLASAPASSVARQGDRLRVSTPFGKKSHPDLQEGPAALRVNASRPVLRGLRQVSNEGSRNIQIRLVPPRISVVSTHHYINLGGSEMIVYRVSPADVESGVRVGEVSYPGFPGAGAWLSDPELKVAFFALLYDQKPNTPFELFARDAAGNTSRAQFNHRVFPKAFRRSKIPLDDDFLSRVVPAILEGSSQPAPSGDLLPAFLKINNDLRRTNNEAVAALSKKTAPRFLWAGAFQPLGGSQVESSFADFRTYFYRGKEVDRQVHLGFDLAKTANAPVTAANSGTVVVAQELGIYGNTVVIDHGMGVQSLYAHLSSFAVKEGDQVKQSQQLGASGQTGLAGGDHLHFSMLVNGRFVNATEWWDAHWIEDRILRKLRDAGASIPDSMLQP